MRVLLCHNYYRSSAPSGEDVVFRNECELLTERGEEVIPFERFNDDIDDSTIFGQVNVGISTAWSRQSYKDISEVIKKERPDVAHFHNTFPLISPSAYKACHDNEVPVVQTLHNFRFICPGALLQRNDQPCEDCVGTSLIPALRHKCYRGSFMATLPIVGMITWNRLRGTYEKLVDTYIALTQFAASRLQNGGLPRDRLFIKPNFLPDPPQPGRGDGGYAVYTGRLSPEKGVRTLLRAWVSLRNIPLVVLGDGPLKSELQAFARQHRIPAEFRGSVDRNEVLSVVGNAAMQIIPSEWYEGFPMVVLEAYACGTPIVASRIGSLDELITEDITGTKFSPADPTSLAKSVQRLWNQSAHLATLRRNAREVFDSHYTERVNYNLLKNIYTNTLRRRE